MQPNLMPDIPVSIISRDSHLVYSGMFPSVIANSISLKECLIDIQTLAKNAKVSFIKEEVKDIDFNLNKVVLENRPSINYSHSVLDFGSQTIIPREFENLVKTKIAFPIKPFLNAYELIKKEDYAACAWSIQNLAISLASSGVQIKWSSGEIIRSKKIYNILK